MGFTDNCTYDINNIFAKILRGELPKIAVYEDEHTLAFMDIMPAVEGHIMVIPKEPGETIFDISPEAASATIRHRAESRRRDEESAGRAGRHAGAAERRRRRSNRSACAFGHIAAGAAART